MGDNYIKLIKQDGIVVCMKLRSVRKALGTDTILLFFVGVSLLGFQLVLPASVRNLFTPVVVVMLAILSYRFAVESEIRNAVDELESMEFGCYRVTPVLHEVKWRPQLVTSACGFLYSPKSTEGIRDKFRDWTQRRTAIIFKVYRIDEGIYPANAEDFVDNLDIDLTEFYPADKIYTEGDTSAGGLTGDVDGVNGWMRDISGNLAADPRLHEDGLYFTIESLNGRDIQNFADRISRQIRDQIVESDEIGINNQPIKNK